MLVGYFCDDIDFNHDRYHAEFSGHKCLSLKQE